MRIAILGTRGIPANYGGFETFTEELATRLVRRGHEVTVYCRQQSGKAEYRGVRLVYLPTIRHKYLDTLAHTFCSTLHLARHPKPYVLYCNAANALFTGLPRLLGMSVAINVDGLERKRKKWNRFAKTWYLVSEWLSTKFPHVTISDAQKISEYYQQRYGKATVFIPYGAPVGKVTATATLERLGLEPGRYFLYVSRMEPENNALLVREAFEQVETDMKLALIGDAPYAHEYIQRVRDTKDPRIIMPGAIYGEGYRELQSHCFAYIHATEVGGTHPALIEAMGAGALTLFLHTAENDEVAGGVGIGFEQDTLAPAIQRSLLMHDGAREELRFLAQHRVRERYSWDAVTDAYESLFEGLA